MPEMTFRVDGEPAPKGSKTAMVSRSTGRAILVEGKGTTGKRKYRQWNAAVRDQTAAFMYDGNYKKIDGPVEVTFHFYLTRPKSVTVRKRPFPCVKPDVDKLLRSTKDGLTKGGLYVDDALVCDGGFKKRYATEAHPPGCEMFVRVLDHTDLDNGLFA